MRLSMPTEYLKKLEVLELQTKKARYEAEATRNTNLAKALEAAIKDFDQVK